MGSAFLHGVHHAYAQTDGNYAWPNNREGDLLREAKREIEAKQARIDALMLEYCPDEMTPEQLANWERYQKPVEISSLDEMRELLKVPNAKANSVAEGDPVEAEGRNES